MNTRIGWGQPPSGWSQPHLSGWAPLVDHGPLPLQTARSVGRWLWPTLVVGGFLAVVAYTFGHDDPAPGLSHRGLLTVALAAAIVVLLTIHRRSGPGPLARAVTEYAVVALLAVSLAAPGGVVDQQPADAKSAKANHAKAKPAAKPKAEVADGDDRPGVLQAGAKLGRALTRAVRAVVGAARWLADLWRQADEKAKPTDGEAMAASPLSPRLPVPSTWRSP